MKTVDLQELKRRLSYDPASGELRWLPRDRSEFGHKRDYEAWRARYENKRAFTAKTASGYHVGRFDGVNIYAHRVAWVFHSGDWPDGEIDHINGDRTDNRIANLRAVTTALNAKNKRMDARNSSGVTGVYWHKSAKRWAVSIGNKSLGCFVEFQDAVNARRAEEIAQGYHQNHGRAA